MVLGASVWYPMCNGLSTMVHARFLFDLSIPSALPLDA